MQRRQFLKLTAGAAGAAALAVAGIGYEDQHIRYALERRLGMYNGPDLHLPRSGARMYEGTFDSTYVKGPVGWAYSLPAHSAPRAIVVGLYGKDGNQYSVFDQVHLPDAAAYVGAPVAVASAYGGADSYWHKRADGTDAHAMVTEELVPMLTGKLGPLPLALYGYSMGGYGALLAAEKGARAGAGSSAGAGSGGAGSSVGAGSGGAGSGGAGSSVGAGSAGNMFAAVAAASPALWRSYSEARPGAFDSAEDFAANDVFSGVGALRSLRVRLDCGDLDPFYDATRQLSAMMTWPHVAVFTSGAAHEIGYWRWAAPAQMRFLAEACGVKLAGGGGEVADALAAAGR